MIYVECLAECLAQRRDINVLGFPGIVLGTKWDIKMTETLLLPIRGHNSVKNTYMYK